MNGNHMQHLSDGDLAYCHNCQQVATVREAYTDTGETVIICEQCLQAEQLDELETDQRPQRRSNSVGQVIKVLTALQQSMTEAGFIVVINAQVNGTEYRIDGFTPPVDREGEGDAD